jgi:hypothetical protein
MQVSKCVRNSGLALFVLGAAGLIALPVAAQTSPGTTPAATTAKQTDDDAAEFAKLDKNNDGVIDKSEAVLEPRLLSNFDAADTNKDGKIDKGEWAAFQKNKSLIIKKQ